MDHNSPEYLAALEDELRGASNIAPGGQPVDEGRVAAINAEIERVKQVLASAPAPEPEPTDTPADKSGEEEEQQAEPEHLETADSTEPLENTDGPSVA